MAHRTDDPYEVENESFEEVEPRKRGLLSWILIVGLLIGTGSGSAVAYNAFGRNQLFSFFQSPTQPVAAATKPMEPADVESLQKQIASSVQATEARLAAQQAELKRLTDEVTALAGRLDILMPTTPARGAVPTPTIAIPKKRAAKPAAAKPNDANPPGPVSTGGTPLPLNR